VVRHQLHLAKADGRWDKAYGGFTAVFLLQGAIVMLASTNVFIVEDSAPIRERLNGLLGDIEGVHVVGEADTPQSAVEGIMRTRPCFPTRSTMHQRPSRCWTWPLGTFPVPEDDN
jgi:hypothetical protein